MKNKLKDNKIRWYKTQKGITLLVLIITIIIMLILVGVSYEAIFGEVDIQKQADELADKTAEHSENMGTIVQEVRNQIESGGREEGRRRRRPRTRNVV